MLRIHRYKQQRTHKEVMQAHYFKNGAYVRSSDVLPYSKDMLRHLVKGHSKFSLVQVLTKTELAYTEYTVRDTEHV